MTAWARCRLFAGHTPDQPERFRGGCIADARTADVAEFSLYTLDSRMKSSKRN
jgi:hypothetical protein